ncbi:hypothetical protein H4R21_005120, partial [Coemansia helicoidea]
MAAGNPLFAMPAAFSGKGNVREWIKSMLLFIKHARPNTSFEEGVEAILANTTGPAHTWSLQQLGEDNRLIHSADETLDQFKAKFIGVDDEAKAEQEMAVLKQRSSVEDYVNAFERIAVRLPQLSSYDLRVRFITGLKPDILKAVRTRKPDTLEEAKRLAELYDRDYTVPRAATTARPASDAMDVDAAHIPRVLVPLTDQDREYCAANGLCFRCRQPGHSSRDCTRSFNHRNSNSNNNNHRNNNNRNNNN